MQVIVANNQLDLNDKKVFESDLTSVNQVVKLESIDLLPIIVFVNDEITLRCEWDKQLEPDSVVRIHKLLLGGNEKNPLAMMAGVALTAYGGIALTGWKSWAAMSAGTALAAYGMGSPMLSPSVDRVPVISPTYSSNNGNFARIGQTVPVLYGVNKIYPDLASQPYRRYESGEQYLHCSYIVGFGSYSIDDLKLGDAHINTFEKVTFEKVNPNTKPTLFKNNVKNISQLQGQELKGYDSKITPSSYNWLGGIYTKTADKIEIDVSLERGLFQLDSAGKKITNQVWLAVDIRPIGGSWTTYKRQITGNDDTPIRKTYEFNLVKGEYEIRVCKYSSEPDDYKIVENMNVTGGREYLGGDISYRTTTVQVKIKLSPDMSSEELSKFNLVATRIKKVDHTSITLLNPARVIHDMLTDNTYGISWPESRIDMTTIRNLWLDNTHSFNAIFDRKMSAWEAINLVCRTFNATPIIRSGLFSIVVDEKKIQRSSHIPLPICMFTAHNIVEDSFSISYTTTTEYAHDAIEIVYIDESDWKEKIYLTSVKRNNTKKLKLFGVTNRPQAVSVGNYLHKSNKYRRKTIKLSTELEGLIPTLGDLVVVSHDMVDWGSSGEITNISSDGKIYLSETLPDSSSLHIFFRDKVSGPSKALEITKSDDGGCNFNLAHTISTNNGITTFTFHAGFSIELAAGTIYCVGTNSSFYEQCLVKSVKARNDTIIDLELINYDERVYS